MRGPAAHPGGSAPAIAPAASAIAAGPPSHRRRHRHTLRSAHAALAGECGRPESRCRQRMARCGLCRVRGRPSSGPPETSRSRSPPAASRACRSHTSRRWCSRACRASAPSYRPRRHRAQRSGQTHARAAAGRGHALGATCPSCSCDSPRPSGGWRRSLPPARSAGCSRACRAVPPAVFPGWWRPRCGGCRCP